MFGVDERFRGETTVLSAVRFFSLQTRVVIFYTTRWFAPKSSIYNPDPLLQTNMWDRVSVGRTC